MAVAIVIVAIIVVLLIVGLVLLAQRRAKRRREMQEMYGSEYDRAVEQTGSHRAAERELAQRQEQRAQLQIVPLSESSRTRYTQAWSDVQGRFVDDPQGALSDADELVTAVMRERGYPTEGFDEQARLLSVDHANTLDNYRSGHHIAGLARQRQATTEQLRQGMMHYRSLFTELVEDQGDRGRDAGAGTGAVSGEQQYRQHGQQQYGQQGQPAQQGQQRQFDQQRQYDQQGQYGQQQQYGQGQQHVQPGQHQQPAPSPQPGPYQQQSAQYPQEPSQYQQQPGHYQQEPAQYQQPGQYQQQPMSSQPAYPDAPPTSEFARPSHLSEPAGGEAGPMEQPTTEYRRPANEEFRDPSQQQATTGGYPTTPPPTAPPQDLQGGRQPGEPYPTDDAAPLDEGQQAGGLRRQTDPTTGRESDGYQR